MAANANGNKQVGHEPTFKNGELAVGVKTDFGPFGQLDPAGRPVGFEVDLAKYLADALGLKLKLVGVTTTNRFDRLEQGAVDVIVATVGDTDERRKVAAAIEPDYYGAGVSVLLRPEKKAQDWGAIRGATVCALQGAYFNRAITQRYLLDLQMYGNVRDALLALKDGRCIGFLYSDTAIHQDLKESQWAGYHALPTALFVPWAIFIPSAERGSAFERLISDAIAGFHRDGVLIRLERTWGLAPSPFLQDQRTLWSARTASGHYICARQANGEWPVSCRNRAFITAADSQGVSGFGLWLKEKLGLDLSFLYDAYDSRRYLKGIGLTIVLVGLSILGSLVFGYWGAKIALAGGWTAWLARELANYARMTPPLLQMYLLFFGLGSAMAARLSISLPPLVAAIVALSIYHGAMIMYTLIEAVEHLRASRPGFHLIRANLQPVVAYASVGVRTALVNLTKATTIASAISVPELLSATVAIMSDRGEVPVMMNALLLVFFFMSVAWLYVLSRIEARLRATKGAGT